MTLGEFKVYYAEHTPDCILFWAENQDWHCVGDPCGMKLRFTSLRVSLAPDVMLLTSGSDNVLWFNDVLYVDVDPDDTILGTMYHVVCPGHDGSPGTTYSLLAIKNKK
jgi:hypothetical protein